MSLLKRLITEMRIERMEERKIRIIAAISFIVACEILATFAVLTMNVSPISIYGFFTLIGIAVALVIYYVGLGDVP